MKKNPFHSFVDNFEERLEDRDPDFKDSILNVFKEFYGQHNLRYKSPIGYLDVVQNNNYLTHIYFNDSKIYFAPESSPKTDLLKQTKDILDRYFDGESVDFREIPIKTEMETAFQNSVWNTIHEIPYGEVRSYKWIAEKIVRPKAVRAVGNATGDNPISIIIPCHRVIGSSGNLGGYGGGIERKQQLLKLEGYPIETLKLPRKEPELW